MHYGAWLFIGALSLFACSGSSDGGTAQNGGSAGKGGKGGSGGFAGSGGFPSGGTGGVGGSGATGGTLACDSGFTFSKNPAIAGEPFNVSYTADTGYTYIAMEVSGPGSPATSNQQITGSGPFTWAYTVSGHGVGVLTFTFVQGKNNGNPGTPVATCQINSISGGSGGTGGGGTGGTGGGTTQGFVNANGTSFTRDGKDYRFVGANLRGLTHYGHGDVLPYADAGQIELNLSALQGMNGKVVRSFVAYQGIDAQATGDRLGAALDALAAHGQTMIVVLTDFYSTPFHPAGDDGFYATDGNNFTVLSPAFWASGYQNNYKPQALALVSRFKDHPAIFSWELGNEIRDATFSNSNPDAFAAFCQDMAGAIRGIDSNHMISVGEISALNNGLNQAQAQALYSSPNISFLTDRSYDGGSADDTGFAASLGKPIIIEEAGYQGGDRPSELSADLGKWFGKGARGYLQWGYSAAASDNGDGDQQYGMDKVWHTDWDGLYSSYSSYGAGL